MRTAKQAAASRRNLAIARSKRRRRPSRKTVRRVAKTVGVVGLVAGSAYAGSKSKHVNVARHTLATTAGTKVSPHRVRSGAFKKANYPHTAEAKAHANIKYRHSGNRVKYISSAEVIRRTNSYEAIRGKKVTSAERLNASRKYRKQTV